MGEEKKVEKKEKKDNNTTVLTIIAIATLLIALVGATFAYFTASANNENNQSVSITTAAPVALEYQTNGAIALTDAKPGDHGQSSFTVTNPTKASDQVTDNTLTYTYDLNLITINDSFVADASGGANQLILTVTETTNKSSQLKIPTGSPLVINLTDGSQYPQGTSTPVVDDQSIVPGETHTYTADLDFAETSTDQNSNASKSYAGHFDISDTKQAN